MPVVSPLVWRAISYALIAVFALGVGWSVRGWKEDSADLKAMNDKASREQFAREVVAEVADKTLKQIGGIRVTNTTIYQKTRHEITREPMPADCRIPASWMLLIRDARSGVDRSGAAPVLP